MGTVQNLAGNDMTFRAGGGVTIGGARINLARIDIPVLRLTVHILDDVINPANLDYDYADVDVRSDDIQGSLHPYYEDDTGNCKWLKETKCTTVPRRKREKVCKDETFQSCHTAPAKQTCEKNSHSTYQPFTKETCQAELRGNGLINVVGAWCRPLHTAQTTCKVS